MRRRRLIAVVVLLLVAFGSLVWSDTRLTSEEDTIIGKWSYPVSPPNDFWPAGGTIFHHYGRDRICRIYGFDEQTHDFKRRTDGEPAVMLTRWSIRGGKLIFDDDAGLLERIRRNLPARLPWVLPRTLNEYVIERPNADEMVLHNNRYPKAGRLTRVPEK